MALKVPVRPATPEDLDDLAHVLALAFDNDPVTRWHLPEDSQRIPTMERFFEFTLQSMLPPLGAVWTTEDRAGVAGWLPHQPAQEPDADESSTSALDEIFGRDAWMVQAILRVQQEHQPAEQHHYLQFMGTRPDRQGSGIGTALMSAGLAWCDADSLPAYLDASSPLSRDFYIRFGFSVVDTFEVPDGPRFWHMLRAPSARTPAIR